MPRSIEEAQAIDVMRYHDADIIEWRADFLPKEAILQVAPAIFEKFAGRELVFTLRTCSEGGQIELSSEEYVQIIKEVAQLINQIISILSILAIEMFLRRCWSSQTLS